MGALRKTGNGPPAWFAADGRRIEFLVFASSLVVYLVTLAPGLMWGDSAEFSRIVDSLGMEDLDFGKAASHPLYLIVGRLFALLPGSTATNLNWVSALFAALTVWLVYRTVREMTGSVAASLVGAVSLCLSHAFWLHAVIAEVYTMNCFFVASVLYLCMRWRRELRAKWALLAMGTLAVGLTCHLVLASIAPAVLFIMVAVDPRVLLRRRVIWSAAVLVALLLAAVILAPDEVGRKVHKLVYGPPSVFEYFWLPRRMGRFLSECLYYVAYLFYQFPLFGVSLGVLGAWQLLRRNTRTGVFLALAMGVNALFFVKTTVWGSLGGTKYTFYIADYVVFSIFIGYGAGQLMPYLLAVKHLRLPGHVGRSRVPGTRSSIAVPAMLLAIIVAPPAEYWLVPVAAKATGLDLLHARAVPYRDNDTYFLRPWKCGYRGAHTFAVRALEVMAPGSIMIADYTPWSVMAYVKEVEGVRPDVRILKSDRVARYPRDLGGIVTENVGHVGVYIAETNGHWTSYNYPSIPRGYGFVPAGPVYEIVRVKEAAP